LQEKSPAYMTARSSYTALQNLTKDLIRTTSPRLPPALGFDGDTEYAKQVDTWKKWTEWEKDDPLVLKDEDLKAYQKRVLYVYKQAAMALRFWPELWYDAAEFCFSQGLSQEGDEFLTNGAAANPESCLLAFKRADRIEIATSSGGGDEGAQQRGAAVREPYDKVLDALYELIKKASDREAQTIARVKENFAQQRAAVESNIEDDDDDILDLRMKELAAAEKMQIEAIEKGNAAQIKLLSRTISFAWIALMRAMRRVQGKGTPTVGGARGIFTDARKRGRVTSDVYIASALIEYHCYKDPAATKIFERGIKLFPDDENFAMEYLKHLIAINDITSTFSTLTAKHPIIDANKRQMLVPSSRRLSIVLLRSPKPFRKPNLSTITSMSTRLSMVS
jgi:cleavage stimulation factor subunit 3